MGKPLYPSSDGTTDHSPSAVNPYKDRQRILLAAFPIITFLGLRIIRTGWHKDIEKKTILGGGRQLSPSCRYCCRGIRIRRSHGTLNTRWTEGSRIQNPLELGRRLRGFPPQVTDRGGSIPDSLEGRYTGGLVVGSSVARVPEIDLRSRPSFVERRGLYQGRQRQEAQE